MLLRFVLLSVLVGGSFAFPYMPSDTSDTTTPFPTDFPEFVKKFSSDFDHVFTDFIKNVEWIFRQIDSVVRNVLKDGFVGVESWAYDIVGRLEFLSMADGSHFVVPLGGKSDLEKEYKIVSIAVSKLLRNLKSMERTDKLITNVTRELVSGNLQAHKELGATPEKFLRTILHLYIEGLDKKFENDDVLATEYKKQKSAAKESVERNPTMHEPLINVGDEYKHVTVEQMKAFLEDKNVLREAFVNKMFLKMSVKHFQMIFNSTHHTRYLMTRALIQKAQSSGYDSRVNEVYHKALVHARSYINVGSTEEYVPMDALYNAIEKGLSSHPALKKEIQTLMKQIESNSTYDIGMFYIDFSVL